MPVCVSSGLQEPGHVRQPAQRGVHAGGHLGLPDGLPAIACAAVPHRCPPQVPLSPAGGASVRLPEDLHQHLCDGGPRAL